MANNVAGGSSTAAPSRGPRPIGEILESLSLPLPVDEHNALREQVRVEHDRQQHAQHFIRQVGERYAKCAFANWFASLPYQHKVLASVCEWSAGYSRNFAEGLVLYGPVGTGKDHLAVAAVDAVVRQHRVNARWMNGREFCGEVRDRISDEQPEAALIHRLASPDVLLLSDPLPPIGDLTPHQADMLYRVIEMRYAAGKTTCVTLNVHDDSEADRRLGEATWDRLCDGALKIFCKWPSHRKPRLELKP